MTKFMAKINAKIPENLTRTALASATLGDTALPKVVKASKVNIDLWYGTITVTGGCTNIYLPMHSSFKYHL